MKIEFEVPEWAIGRHIHIFAGTELLGNKECRVTHDGKQHVTKYLPLKIKTGRCNGCGSCCGSGGIPKRLILKIKKTLQGFTDYDGACPLLGDTGCILGAFMPFSCVRSVCSVYEGCTEKIEVVE